MEASTSHDGCSQPLLLAAFRCEDRPGGMRSAVQAEEEFSPGRQGPLRDAQAQRGAAAAFQGWCLPPGWILTDSRRSVCAGASF